MTKTRTKLAALLGAGVLAFGVYGLTMAATGASDDGVVPTFHSGNITIEGNGQPDSAACAVGDALEFSGAGDATTTNGVTVHVTYDSTSHAVGFTTENGLVLIAYIKGSDAYNEYDYGAGVDSDGNLFAPDAGNSGAAAALSHAIFCTGPSEQESQPVESSAAPSFNETGEPATNVPSEPNTATSGSTSGGPSDSSWLLVAALGVLLASVVVMTPARAKNRR